MKYSLSKKVGLCTWLWLGLAAVVAAPAAEPAREFLQALRQREYHDMAVEFLERMKTSPMAPVELKETLQYELGVTLIQSSRIQRDPLLQEEQLTAARTALETFIQQRQGHPLVSSANSQLGNLLVERARIKVKQSTKLKADAKKTGMAAALKLYNDGFGVFDTSKNNLKQKLSQPDMKTAPPNDKKKKALIDRLRADYLQVQLLAAAVKEEMADTQDEGSAEYKKLVEEAGTLYGEIYTKYRTRLAGLYARMYQGRCSHKLEKYKDALSYFSELMEQPSEHEAFRDMITKTMLMSVDCWGSSKPPLYAAAVDKVGKWVGQARPNEMKTMDWLTLRLKLAKSQVAFAKELEKKDPKDTDARKSRTDARKNAQYVSKNAAGDLQTDARNFLASIGGPAFDPDAEKKDIKTFAEAKAAGKEALDAMQVADVTVKRLKRELAAASDKAELQKKVETAQQAFNSSRSEAIDKFRMALGFADLDTPVADVNIVRYFLCYLYYTRADYFESGLLGSFVAHRYPDSSVARQCAKISMASNLKLYSTSQETNKDFETAQVIDIAKFITVKWDGKPEAIEALNTLIPFMIKAGDLEAAEGYLAGMPENSPKRKDAEIKTGQAMWSAYLKDLQTVRKWENNEEPMPEGTDLAAKKATMDQLKDRAQKILAAGVARMQAAGTADSSGATAALSLVQIYVDTQKVDQAIALMEDAGVGPLTLVRKKDPVTEKEGYAAEVYKAALRSYISSLADAPDADAVIKKATGVMEDMKSEIEQKRLIAMYVSLARELQRQMEIAPFEAKKKLADGFNTFLRTLRSDATDFTVLNWVAETFTGLAKGYDTQQKVTPEAMPYYTEAAQTHQTILDKVPFEGDIAKYQLQMRMKLASTHRRMGGAANLKTAKEIFLAILKDKPSMMDVQKESAKLYQEWALFGKDDAAKIALYQRAMAGYEKAEEGKNKGKNIIWGWGRLAKVCAQYAEKYPHLKAIFHESRYNLAVCRYEQAKLQSSPADTKSYLEKAESSIISTKNLYGTGKDWDTWKPKYEKLLVLIQKALKKKADGFGEGAAKKAA